ncbi:Fibronectin type III domain [uncultured Clostridium sp.]|nr:Fibronectin type III domain [uncultured Clostridium sp.]
MKKTLKMILTTCLLLLTVCGASLSVSARSYYYKGLISIDPSFPDSVFDANEEIQIPLTVKRFLSNNTKDFLSKYYCDVYGPRGTRISNNYGYLSDMTAPTLNWTIFDRDTPRDFGTYTVKYYTSNDEGGTCYFHVNSISGTFGAGLKWSYDGATQELKISGSGSIPTDNLPWRDYEESIRTIIIEEGITSVGEYTFWKYPNLTSVTLPSTFTRIGKSAFKECLNLTSINFPDRLMQIGEYAFDGCSFLQDVKLPNNLRIMGTSCFKGTAIKTIEIPSSMITIPQRAFDECYYLETITLPNTLRGIETCAFKNCSGLRSVIYKGTTAEWSRINIDSYGNDALVSAAIKTSSSPMSPATPNKITLAKTKLKSVSNIAGGIKVTWNKVKQAGGYYIYRKTGTSKTWQKIATIKKGSTVSYVDKKRLVNGTQYTYMVKAYKGSSVGTGTTLKTVRLAAPAITSCTSRPRAITLKWKKSSNVTGYEIRYTIGSSSKTIRVKNKAAVKSVIKNLKKGKTYTVRMRTYKTISKKTYYSTWSAAKKTVIR